MTVLLLVVITALIFEFINGFHDTANAIATSVATKVLTPRQAIILAAVTNLLGALWGTAVAKTIASGLVDTSVVNSEVIFCALIGGIVWNLLTWWLAIPSSSSHALIGGLCGAAFAAANESLSVIIWSVPSTTHWYEGKGLLWKVLIPTVFSPLLGFGISFLFMGALYISFKRTQPQIINKLFARLQIVSAAGMGFMHGTNDAQKTMGIIALALLAATGAGTLDDLPSWLNFLRIEAPTANQSLEIGTWIKVLCALTMAGGTAVGGWKIIKTLGHRMARLQPIHGFAAEASSSLVLFLASHFGIPVSTTHNISSAVMGVGAARRMSNVRWTVVERMLWAWIFTLPCSAIVAYAMYKLVHLLATSVF